MDNKNEKHFANGENPDVVGENDENFAEELESNKKIVELEADKLKLLAELDNQRKRGLREVSEAKRSQIKAMAMDLLTIADQLEQAKSHMESISEDDPVMVGLNGVLRSLSDFLGKWNIVPIDIEIGVTTVNPNYHEIISTMGGEPDVILEVVQKGYLLKSLDEEYVLRPAKVVVGN